MDVLIVDDDHNIREMLGLVLEDAGHTVRVASDGLEAMVAIEEYAPSAWCSTS